MEREKITREVLLKLIDQAAREGWTELNVSREGLDELPPEISQLTNLTELFLGGNQLAQLPLEFSQLTNLKILSLRNNQLAQLPPEISQLTNLTTLDLSDNPLENPPLEVARQGIDAIRAYFEQLEREGTDTLYEAKLLIGNRSPLPPSIPPLTGGSLKASP